MLKQIGVVCAALLLPGLLGSGGLLADELKLGKDFVGLTKDKPYLHVIHEGRSVKVTRVQDPDYELKGYFAKTSRRCPPFCLKPISPAPGIRTIGEVEMFDFMENQLRDGTGILVDARTPAWYERGTIPGSINIPFTILTKSADDPEMIEALEKFGARQRKEGPGFFEQILKKWGWKNDPNLTDKWDFSQAKQLVVYCNGPDCGQSPRAIRGLIKVGYPKNKIWYYRGGMRMWQFWGLTTVVPKK